MSTDPQTVGSRPAWDRIVDGALFAIGAGVATFVLTKIWPTKPTVVVLASSDEVEGDAEE